MKEQLPISIATAIERPDGERWFAPVLLQLFERFSRGAFYSTFGRQAPPVNLDLEYIQLWWDTDAGELEPDGVYRYQYAGQDPTGKMAMLDAHMTNAMAAMPNIPGQFNYPEYTFAPTEAFIASSIGNRRQLIPADRLSSRASAERVLAEIKTDLPSFVGHIGEAKLDGSYFKYIYEVNDPDNPEGNFQETRRLWHIKNEANGGFLNVGRLLRKMNAKGRAAPGNFIWNPGVALPTVMWVNMLDLEDDTQTLPELPVPCRDLADDEELVRRSPFDQGTVQVNSAPNPNEVEVKGGAAANALIDKMWNLLVRIAAKFGIEVAGDGS
jgi:hypothetical protein